MVASLTDAWIETITLNAVDIREKVASLTDAWIETSELMRVVRTALSSHPSRMRGLKHK